mmetsp:Transcript_7657/g.23044  ORF Transcript_7657/g.23044 Transcript_7657/m.23044 type:complete len:246 (+) Transcript_7657:243-980(+)
MLTCDTLGLPCYTNRIATKFVQQSYSNGMPGRCRCCRRRSNAIAVDADSIPSKPACRKCLRRWPPSHSLRGAHGRASKACWGPARAMQASAAPRGGGAVHQHTPCEACTPVLARQPKSTHTHAMRILAAWDVAADATPPPPATSFFCRVSSLKRHCIFFVARASTRSQSRGRPRALRQPFLAGWRGVRNLHYIGRASTVRAARPCRSHQPAAACSLALILVGAAAVSAGGGRGFAHQICSCSVRP